MRTRYLRVGHISKAQKNVKKKEVGRINEDKGALTDEQYKKQLDSIIDGFDFKFTKGWQISWLPDTGSEATLFPKKLMNVSSNIDYKELDKAVCLINSGKKIALYDGKLYYKFPQGWGVIEAMSLSGDGAASTKEQMEGICDIVVRMLEKKEEQEKQQ